MSSLQSRKDEIAAKRAKLAELKRQRELRAKDVAGGSSRAGAGDVSELVAQPSPLRSRATQSQADLDQLISSLVPDRPTSSAGPRTPGRSPGKRVSGGGGQLADEDAVEKGGRRGQESGREASTQTLGFAELRTVYEIPVESRPEVMSYSKGVQTSEPWDGSSGEGEFDNDADGFARGESSGRRGRRKRSAGDIGREQEAIRERLRGEIEEELRAVQLDETAEQGQERFPVRALAPEELNAVTSSADFLDFVERSSKVLERALDEDYDLLTDYGAQPLPHNASDDDNDDDDNPTTARRSRRLRETASYPIPPASGAHRILSSLDFSPKFPELLCAAYTKPLAPSPTSPPGLLNIFNLHL
ncbi:hypothetical protein LTR53_013506, partial [Teratosphaeriaceae sp. CCFEE 6253]